MQIICYCVDSWIIRSDEGNVFTCVALHASMPTLYIGTSRGEIIRYDLEQHEIDTRVSINSSEEVSFPLVDITYNEGLLYTFQSTEIMILTEELEVIKRLDIGEEIIAATFDRDHERVLTVTRSGHIAIWNTQAEFQEASITIQDLTGIPKLQLLDTFIVLLSYPTGKVVQANLKTNTYRSLESFDKIDYLLTTFYFDSNNTHLVNLQLSGEIHIYEKPVDKLTIGRSLKSYQGSNQPPLMSLKQALLSRPVKERTHFIVNQITGKLANLSENSADYKALTPSNYMDLSSDKMTVSMRSKSHLNNHFHKLLTDFEINEKEETLAEIVNLCKQQFLNYNFLMEAWYQNDQTPDDLTEDARFLELVYKRRISQRTSLISLESVLFLLGILLIAVPPYLSDSLRTLYETNILLVSIILAIVSMVTFLIHFRINSDPYISFFSTYIILGGANLITSLSLLVAVIIPHFSS